MTEVRRVWPPSTWAGPVLLSLQARIDWPARVIQPPVRTWITWTRIGLMSERTDDWADHYPQFAIYLRLSGLIPPTARR
jgi:hypothetical protein